MSSFERRKQIFKKTLDNLKTLIDQLKDESLERTNQSHAFAQDLFWKNISEASVRLSHEATKISLSFSKPPFPDVHSSKSLCTSLEMSCLALVSVFYGFPKTEGLTLRKQISKSVIAIVESIYGLISDITEIKEEGTREVLHSTGGVWEISEKLKTLPKDNKEAVVTLILLNSELIGDALEELESEINECNEQSPLGSESDNDDGENDDDLNDKGIPWSSRELDICKVSLGLIKTAHACTRKTSSVISETEHDKNFISVFDDVVSKIEVISPSVDDFVSSLYPTIRQSVVLENATSLADHLKVLLNTIKESPLCSSDESWLQFLTKAVDHNLTKVENLTGKSRLG